MAWFSNRLGVAALAAVCLAGLAHAEKIGIAATVNDEVITTTDVAARRTLIMDASDIPVTPENERRITPRILQALIEETLELQEAKRQSITVSQAEIDKALDDLGARQKLPPGELKKTLQAKGLSVRSLENQVKAQLAWTKVVQRKLRRNVTVTQDELLLAQQAQAAAPGVTELRLTALVVPITPQSKEAEVKARVGELNAAITGGQPLAAVAEKYAGKGDVQFTAPVWVAEDTLPADVQRLLRETEPGKVAGPVRTGNVIQFVEVLEKRVTKRPPAATELLLKQIGFDLPVKPDKAMQKKVTDTVALLRKDPGSCESDAVPSTPLPVQAVFATPTVGNLTPEQVNIVARLNVGEVSEPLVMQGKLRLILLCEKREPTGAVQASEALRQELFASKMDLEAQKHLRNLRRDASIEIREVPQ